jgi:hypothetical protein
MDYTKAAMEYLKEQCQIHFWYMSDVLNDIVTYIEDKAETEGLFRIGKKDIVRLLSPFVEG